MKQPKPYLLGVISGIDAIISYLPENEAAFIADPKSQDAILMRLQDIGENLSKLRDGFPEFWATHTSDTWLKAIGLRNIIAHGYAEIDLTVIWNLISKDFPAFRQSVQEIL